jgi:hypothetical protein
MEKDHNLVAGDFLLRYYIKRSTSLLVSLYKSGVTLSEPDIHKARVQVKKFNALLGFFNLLHPKSKPFRKYLHLLKNAFSAAGYLRETQIILATMDKFHQKNAEVRPFVDYLHRLENRRRKTYYSALRSLDDKSLREARKSVKALTADLNSDDIVSRCEAYIQKRISKILAIRPLMDMPVNLHTVRKELKRMDAVLLLLMKFRKDESLDDLALKIHRVESLIGQWHDTEVMIKVLDGFFRKSRKLKESSRVECQNLKLLLQGEADQKITEMIPLVDAVLNRG